MGSGLFTLKIFRFFLFLIYLFVEISVEKMDIIKKERYFSKKCLGLYTIETMEFEYLSTAIDFSYFIFHPTIPINAFESISRYLKSGVSTKYELIFHHPYQNLVDKSSEHIFNIFLLDRINNNFWSVSQNNNFNSLKLDISSKNHKVFRKKSLKYFLKYLICVFKVIIRLLNHSNSSLFEFPYIKINDITNGISKEIPSYYQKIPCLSISNRRNFICLKIFSENAILNSKIDKEKLVAQFNKLFDQFSSKIFFGTYINFSINIDKTETHESTDTTMTSYKTTINDYRIEFSDLYAQEYTEGKISVSERSFNFEKAIYDFRYEYFHTSNNIIDSDYKFYILFQRNSKRFEFHYKWYNQCNYNDRKFYSSFYMAVYISSDLHLIEFKKYKNPRYFYIIKVKSSLHKIKYHDNYKISYCGNIIELNRLLDKLIFYQRNEYLI